MIQEKKPIGVLLLHGFTSHISCIDPVEPRVQKLNLPYRMPLLRGHGTQSADLEGVTWQNWVEDGEKALQELLNEAEKVVLVGLSMGCLVALQLAVRYPEKIAGIVCVAPALKVRSKLAVLAPFIARFQKTHHARLSPKSYFDPEAMRTNQNYMQTPSQSVVEFLKFAKATYDPNFVSQITAPIQIIATTRDLTIDHRTAQWLYDNVSSKDKQLEWYHRSGHEMLRDAEKEQVLDVIEAFLVVSERVVSC